MSQLRRFRFVCDVVTTDDLANLELDVAGFRLRHKTTVKGRDGAEREELKAVSIAAAENPSAQLVAVYRDGQFVDIGELTVQGEDAYVEVADA